MDNNEVTIQLGVCITRGTNECSGMVPRTEHFKGNCSQLFSTNSAITKPLIYTTQ